MLRKFSRLKEKTMTEIDENIQVPEKPPQRHERNIVFAVCVNDNLLYATIASNPSKTVRYYRRLGRKDPVGTCSVVKLEMRRKAVLARHRAKAEPYIGPMR